MRVGAILETVLQRTMGLSLQGHVCADLAERVALRPLWSVEEPEELSNLDWELLGKTSVL